MKIMGKMGPITVIEPKLANVENEGDKIQIKLNYKKIFIDGIRVFIYGIIVSIVFSSIIYFENTVTDLSKLSIIFLTFIVCFCLGAVSIYPND